MDTECDYKLELILIDMDIIASDYLSSLEYIWNSLKLFNFELIVKILRRKIPLHFDLLKKRAKFLERIITRK